MKNLLIIFLCSVFILTASCNTFTPNRDYLSRTTPEYVDWMKKNKPEYYTENKKDFDKLLYNHYMLEMLKDLNRGMPYPTALEKLKKKSPETYKREKKFFDKLLKYYWDKMLEYRRWA